jgi:glutamate synthase (ferredoxin)
MLSGELTRLHPEGFARTTRCASSSKATAASVIWRVFTKVSQYLTGDANDYTGKGMSGGRIVVRLSIDFRGDAVKHHHRWQHRALRANPWRSVLQRRGWRAFCRSSVGATTVVEGTGDHGCEHDWRTCRGAGKTAATSRRA